MKDNIKYIHIKNAFSLEEDLCFFYGDVKGYSRNEILRVIVEKFLVLKKQEYIANYLGTIVRFQGKKFQLLNPEDPANSLVEFFGDLIKVIQKVAPEEELRRYYWGADLCILFSQLQSSAHFFAHGLEDNIHHSKSDKLVKQYIMVLSGQNKVKQLPSVKTVVMDIKPVFYKIPEVAKILNCCKDTVYKKHINVLGLKTVKVEGDFMKVAKEDLEEHIERIRTNSVAKKTPI